MDIDQLLAATRSARKSLDLDAPVDRSAIAECLRIGMQAANGSNQRSWRWLVVSEVSLRAELTALYRDAYLGRVWRPTDRRPPSGGVAGCQDNVVH